MKLQFLGANRQVTGSRYCLEAGGLKLLIDCGVQWMQAGNDFEYMIRGCEKALGEIRGDAQDRSARDSYRQQI